MITQPIGAFAYPAGLLLVADDHADIAAGLCRGLMPSNWPQSLQYWKTAYDGDLPAALDHIAGTDAIAAYNRFVLDPASCDPDAVRDGLPADYQPMVDLVGYSHGTLDHPPAMGVCAPEVRALIAAAHAAEMLAVGRTELAIKQLRFAVDEAISLGDDGRALTGVLRGNLGATLADLDQVEDAREPLQSAVRLLEGTDLTVALAENQLKLGETLHRLADLGKAPLMNAVRHYQAAAALVDIDASPVLFATAQLNLGSAYLTMPMSSEGERIRTAVAMQALRAALRVFTPEAYPREWATAQLNLANALVYAPSGHREHNLVEAVELYQAVADARRNTGDTGGLARVLANQGNALAHLGSLDEARGRLHEALQLFAEIGAAEEADVAAMIGELDNHQEVRSGG